MRLTREHWFQTVGAVVGLGIAYGGVALGMFGLGRAGKAVLIISVPAGVALGWVFVKVLEAAHHIVSDE